MRARSFVAALLLFTWRRNRDVNGPDCTTSCTVKKRFGLYWTEYLWEVLLLVLELDVSRVPFVVQVICVCPSLPRESWGL